MNLWHAVVLGALQGFAEVLPISSSAHLILVPWLLKWPESGLTFDVALHLGTFLALIFYFRSDVVKLVQSTFAAISSRSLDTQEKRLPFLIVAASVPAAIVGKSFEHHIEEIFRSSPLIIAGVLIVFGIILGLSDRYGAKQLQVSNVNMRSAMAIGIFQCLALIPGVSRSGITITAGLLLGFTREGAARFSFLLSLPIVSGAAMLKAIDIIRHGIPAGEGLPMLVGIIVSAITGYISIAFLLRFVQKRSIAPFVWYRLLVGAGIIVAIMAGFKG